jgi:hypothetical protein
MKRAKSKQAGLRTWRASLIRSRAEFPGPRRGAGPRGGGAVQPHGGAAEAARAAGGAVLLTATYQTDCSLA